MVEGQHRLLGSVHDVGEVSARGKHTGADHVEFDPTFSERPNQPIRTVFLTRVEVLHARAWRAEEEAVRIRPPRPQALGPELIRRRRQRVRQPVPAGAQEFVQLALPLAVGDARFRFLEALHARHDHVRTVF